MPDQYGTQSTPLDSFYGAGGTTGNKTTNKDLPQWLKDLGMKGDAYAGGMLKPELRYGFKYQKGKIHFADGTSYDAKKNKDGSYAYTDANGQPASYSPTDEQNSYNKAYKASTGNQSFLDKASNAVKFELDHGAQILKNTKLSQVFFGIDPLGTKIGNAVTGSHAKAQVDQLGGALDSRYADYEKRTGNATGYAKPLQGIAHVIAGTMGGQGLGNAAGNLAGAVGGEGGNAFSSLIKAVGQNPKLMSQLISTGASALNPSSGSSSAGGGAPGGTPSNPFGAFGTPGQGGVPAQGALTADSFPMSGFRDQNAFDYLMKSLNLPSPGGSAAAASVPAPAPAAPPSGLDAFAGMDFSSAFQGLLPPGTGSFGIPSPVDGTKSIQPYPTSSPKTAPWMTAMDAGTRGPSPDPTAIVNSLAGAFGNGGAAMGTPKKSSFFRAGDFARLSSK